MKFYFLVNDNLSCVRPHALINYCLYRFGGDYINTFYYCKALPFIALLLVLPLLSSCLMIKTPDASAVLTEMLKVEKQLPAGRRFTTKSTPGAPDHLSEAMLNALYGADTFPEVFDRVEEISLWLSSGLRACEFGVFLCASRRDAEEVAELCLGRIDTMRHFINLNSEKLSLDSSSAENIKNAKVAVYGRYVVIAVSSKAEKAISAASGMIS